MRYLLIVVFFAISFTASATTYYVSSSGDDNANGLSESSAWKTIEKINSVFSTMSPGDKILFRCGDTFYGSLKITASGRSGNPITISSYGSGEKPVITGFSNVSYWINEGNGIYSSAVSCSSAPNFITINDRWYAMGRYPDNTYLKYESYSTNTSITDNELPASPDWDGAEAVIRKNDWILDRCIINNHSGNTISYTSKGTTINATNNYGYFIQNDIRTLTTFGEWFYNGTRLYVYFGLKSPVNYTVRVPSVNNLIYNSSYDYIDINNIHFRGAIESSINMERYVDYSSVRNCVFNFSGEHAIRLHNVRYSTFDGNDINHSVSAGIWQDSSEETSLTNNTVTNSGMLLGASLLSSLGVGIGSNYCNDILIQYNSVDSSGYNGISFAGHRNIIKNNFVNNSVLLLNDGSGIYTHNRTWESTLVEGNIVLNSYGNSEGTYPVHYYADGIFFDSPTSDANIINNTVAFCRQNGFAFADPLADTIIGNTSFNNTVQVKFQNFISPSTTKNNLFNNNILFAKHNTEKTLKIGLQFSPDNPFVDADGNYYMRPVNDSAHIVWWVDNQTGWADRSLEQWKTQSGEDSNSFGAPCEISNPDDIKLFYNASKTERTFSLSKPMIDAKGTKYSTSVKLQPYTSAILMPDPDPETEQSTVPEYVSSSIENSNNSLLVMVYNQSLLEDVIPPVSAFSVKVNSSTRTVSSVNISGTKVFLTLSSAVAYGDDVTVAYTIPSSNQLQSTDLWWAYSSGTKNVTNNVKGGIPYYVSSSIEDENPSRLEIIYDQTLLESVIPPTSAFSVKVNSVTRSVSSVDISGATVLLTLSSAVAYGDDVTVAYTVPSSNQLQSTARWWAYSSGTQNVTNNVKVGIPYYVSSSIEDENPSRLEIIYDQTLLESVIPPASAFSVKVNSTTRSVSSVEISGSKVLLNLSSAVAYGNDVTVAYTIPSSNQLQSTARWWAYSSGTQNVTNNVKGGIPYYVSSSIEDENPSLIEIIYDQPLLENIIPPTSAFSVNVNSTSRSVSSVEISGSKVLLNLSSAVVSGDVVTVSYTVPSSDQLQSTARWWAYSSGIQSVTNNVYADPHPVYLSSLIQDATPSIVEMTYNMALADIIPSSSAFSVRVNSTARSINSVSISGYKVFLTLASPVVFGDEVTVAYTIPSSNQLQSVTRYWANTISPKYVINYVGNSGIKGTDSSKELKTDTDLSDLITESPVIYPNPASEYINIKLNGISQNSYIIRIYGLSGKVLLETIIYEGINTIPIPADFARGIYVIKLLQDNVTVFTKKLIIK